MKKIILLLLLVTISSGLFAQADTTKEFILIVRYNPKMPQPTKEAITENIQHWDEFMGDLAQKKEIVAGYRPTPEGMVISREGSKEGAYYSNNESISSFIIIKAKNIDDAEAIAKKCPILSFNGTIEVRPLFMRN